MLGSRAIVVRFAGFGGGEVVESAKVAGSLGMVQRLAKLSFPGSTVRFTGVAMVVAC